VQQEVEEESQQVARLKKRREVLLSNINELKEPEGNRSSRRQTKQQRRETVK